MPYRVAVSNVDQENRIRGIHFDTIATEEHQAMPQRKASKSSYLHPSVIKDLIQRCREGDMQAVEAIYGHFSRPLFNLVYRHTYNREVAEDLLQDIFLKVFTHIHTVKKEETFVSWVYRIAINACYSYLRGRKSQMEKTVPLSEVEGKIGQQTYESDENMLKKALEDAVQTLSKKLKAVFLLHDVQGFKHEEIAGMLGCSVGTSKSQLFKARMKIRKSMESKKAF